MTKRILRNTTIISFLLILIFGHSSIAQDKDFKIDPYTVLSGWTYEDVIAKFGEGVNIIDTMSGQAYIAGFRYNDNWIDRPCELEFYFTDVNVTRILLRYNHANNALLEEEDERRKQNLANAGEKDSGSDSLLIKKIKENQLVFDSIAYTKEFLYRKNLLAQDSLRSDSIIRGISEILGSPLKEGPTAHTEKDSRYYATWIKNGYSCSLKDYRKYTVVNFGISPAPGSAINEFNLDMTTKLIEKVNIDVKGEIVEVLLLGQPMFRGSPAFSKILIMSTAPGGAIYLDELPEERQGGIKPRIVLEDLNGDNIPEVWIKVNVDPEGSCVNNFIYTMELKEPLLVFDPFDDLDFGLEGEFEDDYQARVVIDGAARTYLPLSKDKPEYKTIYDSNGKLQKQVKLSPGCIERLEAQKYTSKKGSQLTAYLKIIGLFDKDVVGYVQAVWDYSNGGWEFRSLELWQD